MVACACQGYEYLVLYYVYILLSAIDVQRKADMMINSQAAFPMAAHILFAFEAAQS